MTSRVRLKVAAKDHSRAETVRAHNSRRMKRVKVKAAAEVKWIQKMQGGRGRSRPTRPREGRGKEEEGEDDDNAREDVAACAKAAFQASYVDVPVGPFLPSVE